jgi:hypothetical protein
MQPRLSIIDLEKLNEEEVLFLYGFVIEVLNIDSKLLKSIKKRNLLIKLNEYNPNTAELNKVRLSILEKIK